MLPTLATPVFRPMPMSRCGLPSDSHFFCMSRTRSIIFRAVWQALAAWPRSEEHTSELQSRRDLVCRLLLEKKKKKIGTLGQQKTKEYAEQRPTVEQRY